ncbi:hypothetical protein HPB48_018823 [Haemaphysalis longicornis]|uniref:LIM zinc-binding domain-containing protein n=1 Tax=Haemaphysalis longicornis TaxID=44386 RepID=A0A9J6G0B5_HAELO|nr:hypothetical protein HPB48_018823 [Haemaphysalis longicornis]
MTTSRHYDIGFPKHFQERFLCAQPSLVGLHWPHGYSKRNTPQEAKGHRITNQFLPPPPSTSLSSFRNVQDRGCRSRRPSQPVVSPQRRRSSAATTTGGGIVGGPVPDWEGGGDTFHEDCLVCDTCGLRLAGSSWQAAHRFQNRIYCGLHYADVTGLSSGEEFLAKLREYKRQSLGCAEARRKSSTTLTFPVPVQVRTLLPEAN